METDTTQVDYKVTIRIQRDGYDREVLIPRSRDIVERRDVDNIGNVEEYTLKVIPEYFSYIRSTSNKMLVLDRTKVTEEEAEKIKKEIGMSTFSDCGNPEFPPCTCDHCKRGKASSRDADIFLTSPLARGYLPKQEGVLAYHLEKENFGQIAETFYGTIDYSKRTPVLKFKACTKSIQKDRQATYGTTIYWNGDDERWEVMATDVFLNRYRVAGADEAIY